MTVLEQTKAELKAAPKTWLITGVAGFIGSNLLETLLQLDQTVVGLDNLATGHRKNLDQVRQLAGPDPWRRFTLIEGDLRNLATCQQACRGVDVVLHHAALGSVPVSLEDPIQAHAVNITGALNMLVAARDRRVSRFLYASSSAIYGDEPTIPKIESAIGQALSPYALTKHVDELYAAIFARCYGLETIGFRYFNVFGPRQDPKGAYAAVIPLWIAALIRNEPVYINGDGETTRDFCHVSDIVQVNLLAATTANSLALNRAYNVALGRRTTLNELFRLLRDKLAPDYPHLRDCKPIYREARPGDVRHSQADISLARKFLGFSPSCDMAKGLDSTLSWYQQNVV
ncbi:MAG TPA: SDR family oxidoreductase [Verrucomicrobiae bacterium]|jgi:UDP-N-acetylglucosamine 4-epimerase